MAELSDKTLQQIQRDLISGVTTCEKLVNDYLRNIEANKHLNAYLEVFAGEAVQRAKQLDKKLEQLKSKAENQKAPLPDFVIQAGFGGLGAGLLFG